jgi:hypothetical protein
MKMETRTGLMEVRYSTRRQTFTALVRHDEMTLIERLNEAYHDDELEPEEREFLDLTREHFSRLDDE